MRGVAAVSVKDYKVDLKADPAVARELLRDGWLIADVASRMAPVRTGAGARSIRAELATGTREPEARVSWDQSAWYMQFSEFGSEHQRATPFLRAAANRFR
jgi:HK97 gp10 family phage protein